MTRADPAPVQVTQVRTTPRKPRFSADRAWGVAVLLPSLILLAIFVYGFIFRTGYVSLTDWGNDPAQALALNPVIQYQGLSNYHDLFTSFLDARFRQDLISTVFFTIFFIAGCLALGLGLALMLDRAPRGEALWRTLFLFPMSLSFIVTGTIWRWMLQPNGGVNVLPSSVGLPAGKFEWLSSNAHIWAFDWSKLPLITAALVGLILAYMALRAALDRARTRAVVAGVCAAILLVWAALIGPNVRLLPAPELHGFNLALIGIIIAAIWQMSGYTMALYLAGLRGIPEELREAARVDGAGEVQMYTRVVFPLLNPITLSAMIILGHISLKIFDLVYAMAGTDNLQTEVPAMLLYTTTFKNNEIARGAAIGIVLLILVAAAIIPYLASQFRRSDA